MKQWWNNATITAFRDRAQCIIDQYSRYKVNELGMYMNGKLTQSENIADNGGLKQAFRVRIYLLSRFSTYFNNRISFRFFFLSLLQAYRKWVSLHDLDDDLPGLELNHDQLFFLNYAQIWCGSMRPEDALSKLRSSVHSPGVIRVLGPLSNSKEFSEAYNCPLGSQMNPTNKCSVW